MPCGHDRYPDGTNHERVAGDGESKATPEEADMTQELPDGMSEEEKEQRSFFVGLLGSEVFKRMLEPDFPEEARNKLLEATGQL
jgi:hypothetical protein